MTFSVRDLSVLAYANGFTLWHYKTGKDSLDGTSVPGFFADAGDMMAAGDMLMVSGAGGAKMLCVAMVSAGTVVTAPMG